MLLNSVESPLGRPTMSISPKCSKPSRLTINAARSDSGARSWVIRITMSFKEQALKSTLTNLAPTHKTMALVLTHTPIGYRILY